MAARLDGAIVGPALIWRGTAMRDVVVYDGDLMTEIAMRTMELTREEARLHVEFNYESAYLGEYTPVIVWPQDELMIFDDGLDSTEAV